MKRWICAVLTAAMLLGLSLNGVQASQSEPYDGYLIGVPEFRLQAVEEVEADLSYVCENIYLAESLDDVRAMQEAGLVEFCEPNYPMELMVSQWNMDAIHAAEVWSHQNGAGTYDRRGTGVTVAVIDSGVESSNADFIPEHILPFYNTIDGETEVDIWHGTFVAGLIAAQVDNYAEGKEIGIDGAASDVNILSICVTSSGKSSTDSVIKAIDYAIKQNVDVINLSIGSTKTSQALVQICQSATRKGIILVAAAGNYDKTDTDHNENRYVYPAAYDNVVSVSGCKAGETTPEFDATYSYFNDQVNVCAPGTSIPSLYQSGVASASGTSFAAPQVSAMAAIAKQYNAKVDYDGFMELLKVSTTDLGEPGYDIYYGDGLVNMAAMCEAMEADYPITYYCGTQEAQFSGAVTRSYSFTDGDITLPQPIREGYRFLGWYDNPELTGKPVTTIPTAGIGARSFYSAWEELPNQAPVISSDAPKSAAAAPASEDGLIAAQPYSADISTWFTDPEGDTLTYSLVEGPGTLTGTAYTYTPAQTDGGKTVQAVFRAVDSHGDASPSLTLPITVSELPNSVPALTGAAPKTLTAVPGSLDGKTAPQGISTDVSGWFTDADGDSLTYTITEGPGTLTGTTYSFTPTADQSGKSLSLSVKASDGKAETAAEVAISVGTVPNSAPTVSKAVPQTLFATPASQDGKIPAKSVNADVSEWFTDLDGDSLTYTITEGPGTLTGTDYSFTPTADQSGKSLSLSVKASDGKAEAIAEVTLRIESDPNSAPTLTQSAPKALTAVPGSLDGKCAPQGISADVSDWFTDADGDSLSYRIVEGPGELTDAAYSFTPTADQSGKRLTLQLQAFDGKEYSPILTIAIEISDIPASSAVWASEEKTTINLCNLPTGLERGLLLYGNQVVDVTVDGEPITWSIREDVFTAAVPANLSIGIYTYTLTFDAGEPLTWTVEVVRDCPSAVFTDVNQSKWYHNAIDFAVRNGLMNGMSKTTFAPDSSFTRAMLVTVLWRMADSPEVTAPAPFTDVPSGKWYSDAVAWAAENGIVNGVGEGRFAPTSPVTREQLVVILFRYAGDDGARAGLDGFPDSASVSNYAVEGVDWAIAHGLISGISSNGVVTLSPKTSATRAQVAAILMRFAAMG